MIDVAILNHDSEVLAGLAEAISAIGFTTAREHTEGATLSALAKFIREADPKVVVYDLGEPPYAPAIQRWRGLVNEPGCERRAYVITTNSSETPDFDPGPVRVAALLKRPFGHEQLAQAIGEALVQSSTKVRVASLRP